MAVSKAIIFGRLPSFLENERYWYKDKSSTITKHIVMKVEKGKVGSSHFLSCTQT